MFSTLSYTCSAGIAHAKLLAKLGSAMHKPSGQTIIPLASVGTLMLGTLLQSIRYFGGKLGNQCAVSIPPAMCCKEIDAQ